MSLCLLSWPQVQASKSFGADLGPQSSDQSVRPPAEPRAGGPRPYLLRLPIALLVLIVAANKPKALSAARGDWDIFDVLQSHILPGQAGFFIASACKRLKRAATRCDCGQQKSARRDWPQPIAIRRKSVPHRFTRQRWFSHKCSEYRRRSASCSRFQRRSARPRKKNAPAEHTFGLQNR